MSGVAILGGSVSEPIVKDLQESVLNELAESLDIPPAKYRIAVERYEAVGRWLDSPDSPLCSYHPHIYPQGSFRLGTVVRPVRSGQEADYDIDLVCELGAGASRIDPGMLKNLIGDRLKAHGTYARLLEPEGRRCWTLQYAEADDIGFHLDSLPASRDAHSEIALLESRGVSREIAESAIRITEIDRRHSVYRWVPGGTNPRGYAAWFDRINQAAFLRESVSQKRALSERNPRVFPTIDDVPDGLVRTPLQRVVQLLKRHRDVRFVGHEWESQKPISMILTTVAAAAYEGEGTVLDALGGIVARLEAYEASKVIARKDGEWRVPNPVNPAENFADRWNEPGSHRADAFFEWLRWLRQDVSLLGEAENVDDARRQLHESFSSWPSSSRPSGTPIVPGDRVSDFGDAKHRQDPPWPVRATHRVEVIGSIRGNNQGTKELWRLSSRAIPKQMWIRFSAKTNVRPPFEVKWQVVNTGSDARSAGLEQLRGGFDEGVGDFGAIRWEHTQYRGTHSIEAFVVKDGVCVARSMPLPVRVR